MSARAFLDTNVLVYLFDHDDPVKQQRARTILDEAGQGELALSTQVLSEFYVTATNKLRRSVTIETVIQAIEWLVFLPVVSSDTALVRSAISTSRTAQISYWDGLIVAAAQRAGCERLLTEDLNDGQLIGSVLVENPFRELA
jgi:predicted nucleic acid-binding protein